MEKTVKYFGDTAALRVVDILLRGKLYDLDAIGDLFAAVRWYSLILIFFIYFHFLSTILYVIVR